MDNWNILYIYWYLVWFGLVFGICLYWYWYLVYCKYIGIYFGICIILEYIYIVW